MRFFAVARPRSSARLGHRMRVRTQPACADVTLWTLPEMSGSLLLCMALVDTRAAVAMSWCRILGCLAYVLALSQGVGSRRTRSYEGRNGMFGVVVGQKLVPEGKLPAVNLHSSSFLARAFLTLPVWPSCSLVSRLFQIRGLGAKMMDYEVDRARPQCLGSDTRGHAF